MMTTTSTRAWRSGSAWRRPSSPCSTCSASSRTGRSATCSAASAAARSRSTGPAATRGNTPEEEIDYLKRLVAESGAKALKFRVGGRMSRNADSLPGRSERLIPLVRETFGPEMTIYADSNSSYDAAKAIESVG